MIRRLRAVVTASIAAACASTASAKDFEPGLVRLAKESGNSPAATLVWYPTETAASTVRVGPFEFPAARDAPLANSREPFPVVLISHGRRAGPLSHRTLAAGLARRGFVVVSPAHLGDMGEAIDGGPAGSLFAARTRETVDALQTAFAEARFSGRLDERRMAMIGYSAGGATALALAGATLDLPGAARYCGTYGAGDPGSCTDMPADGRAIAAAVTESRIRAIALLDPAAVLFDRPGLRKVEVPTLVARPDDDALMRAGPNARAVIEGVAQAVEVVVPGNHFVFVDPCPPELAARAPLVCGDRPGVDRSRVQRALTDRIVQFLREALR